MLNKSPKNLVTHQTLTEEEAQKYLAERLIQNRQDRSIRENEWTESEFENYDVGSDGGQLRGTSLSGGSGGDIESEKEDGDNYLAINLINRNIQLLHSQLCSNPPVVTAIPRSSEEKDKDAAIAAEYLMSYFRETYSYKNFVAQATLSAFGYGTGFLKNIFDATRGRIIGRGPIPGSYIMEGDNVYSTPRIWDMYPDANASTWETVDHVYERICLPLAQAISKFGEEKREILEKAAITRLDGASGSDSQEAESLIYNTKYDVVEYFEYWETGSPTNGYQGRFCNCLENGIQLTPLCCSPCKFKQDPKDPDSPTVARLPYSCITYLDLANTIWGRSPIAHTGRAQDMLNTIMLVIVATAQNLGTPAAIVPKGTINEEARSNYSGILLETTTDTGQQPYNLQAASTSADMKFLFSEMKEIVNDGWGVNDAMFGKVARETSGTAMQLSNIQGNLIRQRLFDKYTLMVKDIHELQLLYSRDYWEIERPLEVMGKNSRLEARAFKGADLLGGYSLYAEFGQQFALDPVSRQEQILQILPLFQAAGVDPRLLVRQYRLSEFKSLYDEFDVANDRAKEIIEFIKTTELQSEIPSKYQDHIGILAYLSKYTNGAEYKACSDKVKQLLETHLDARKDMLAQNAMDGGQAPPPGEKEAPPPLM